MSDEHICNGVECGNHKLHVSHGVFGVIRRKHLHRVCVAGSYKTTSMCTICPEYASTSGFTGSDEVIDCKCNMGYTGPNGATCLYCVSVTYKTVSDPQAYTLCDNNTYSSTVATTSASKCLACQDNSISMMGSDTHTTCSKCDGDLRTSYPGAVSVGAVRGMSREHVFTHRHCTV